MSYQRSLSFAVSTFPHLGITSGALTVTASGHGCTASFSCRYKYCTATFWNKGYSWILSSSISERSPRVFLTTLYSLGVCKHSISHLSSLSLLLEYRRVDFILTLSSSTIDATSLFLKSRPSNSISTNTPFALVAFIAFRISRFYRVVRLLVHHRVYSHIITHSYLHTRGYYKVSLVSIPFNFIWISHTQTGLSGNFLLPRFAVRIELHL